MGDRSLCVKDPWAKTSSGPSWNNGHEDNVWGIDNQLALSQFLGTCGHSRNHSDRHFFHNYDSGTTQVWDLISAVSAPIAWPQTDEEVWNRISTVWNWLGSDVKVDNVAYNTLIAEDPVVVLLLESVSEVGEKAVAGSLVPESTGLCFFSRPLRHSVSLLSLGMRRRCLRISTFSMDIGLQSSCWSKLVKGVLWGVYV